MGADVTKNVLFLLGGIVLFIAFWAAAVALRRLIRAALQREHVSTQAIVLGTRIVYFALLIFGAFVAVGVASQSQNVTVIGIIGATVVASLGLQDILRNYVSGFYILFERNIKVGDRIEFGDKAGVVTDIKMRVTLLSGEGGHLVVVPNAELFNSVVSVLTEPAPPVSPRKPRGRPEPEP
jgi:small conductance mechanosensitive channel